jgi:hypothetical protein
MPPDLETIFPVRQRILAISVAVAILILVIELVRRRKLREEYSVLWVVTAIGLLVIAFNVKWLLWATALVGAVQPPSTLFFGGLLFVMLLCLMFSVRISRLTYRLRTVSQRLALLEEELHRRGGATPGGRSEG